jgi:GAF domain-containing protein/HAMP domain-containing protein
LLTRSRDPNIASASTSIAGTPINTLAANLAVKAQQRGVAMYANYRSVDSIGAYRWLPDLQIGLLAEQSQAEAFAANQAVSNFALLAAAVAMLLAAIAAVVVSASLTRPITTLTSLASDTASTMDRASLAGYSQADQGQLNISPLDDASAALQSQLARRDEFGALAAAFDRMTIVLRRLLLGLEARVEQRTAEIQSRSDQILAAAEIGRTAASILETNALMQRVIELIQERFKLYYVGLFLVDENRQVAELAAATGRAGAAMLARRHRLLLGSGAAQSMVAWCIANDQPRIALEAEQDAVRLAAPELPETRSEVAIPLRARQEVIGALSIQSHLHNAFDSDTIVIFQAVASQLAIAIENARLFAASQQALVSLQQAYGEINRRAWLERLSARPIVLHRDASGLSHRDAYILDASIQDVSIQGEHAQGEHAQEVSPHTPAVALPIQARGQTIGYLHARPLSNQPGAWSEEKQELLTTLTEQLSVAIDSARLFEATQQQAARERMVAEISSRMRATLDIDTILQTIAAELCSALELAEVEIRLAGPESMPGETSLMDQAEANRLPHNSDGGAQ